MAKFVYGRTSSGSYVLLEAQDGEELTPEQVVAWAAVQQAVHLEQLSNQVASMGEDLTIIANNSG